MDILELNKALDKLNNVTIPKVEALLSRFEDDAMKDFFGNLNRILDRLGVRSASEEDQFKMVVDQLDDIKNILKRMHGIDSPSLPSQNIDPGIKVPL